ncbi:15089_t:CDS:2 [Acaulospora morrowiae]|uniref:15089_t:CDS:1 n=1 Tax=Acaulospora morrowiae TaxID=94023 RepID=A0A9N9A0F9_9GLOM|nr:15089_t:CDS:2 [Acaulospora morrowiae]
MSFLEDIRFYVHLFNILEFTVSMTCLVFESIFINAFLIYNPNVDSSSYYNVLTKPGYQCFFGTAILVSLLISGFYGLGFRRRLNNTPSKWDIGIQIFLFSLWISYGSTKSAFFQLLELSELSQPISLNITDPTYRYGLNVFARIGYSCYVATICLGFGNAIFYVISAVLVFHWRKNMYSSVDKDDVVDKDEVQSVVDKDEIPNASTIDRDH